MNKMKSLTLQGVQFEVVDEQARNDIEVLKESGGASSWNDLKDKPFGEEKAFEPIVWDGNTEGLECMDMGGNGGLILAKIAETPICADPLLIESMTARLFESGEEASMSIAEIVEQGAVFSDEHGFMIGDGHIICSDGQYRFGNFDFGKGTWVMVQVGLRYISAITPVVTVKPLDIKYLPIEELKAALGI